MKTSASTLTRTVSGTQASDAPEAEDVSHRRGAEAASKSRSTKGINMLRRPTA